MAREPELDVDEPACEHRWNTTERTPVLVRMFDHRCDLALGHESDHECWCRATPSHPITCRESA